MRNIAAFASGAAIKGASASVPYKDNKYLNKYWESKGLDKYTWGYDRGCF